MELELSLHSLVQQETRLKVHHSTAFSLVIILMLIHINRQISDRIGIRSIHTHGKKSAERADPRSSREMESKARRHISSHWHRAGRQSQRGSRYIFQTQRGFHGCSTLSYRRTQI